MGTTDIGNHRAVCFHHLSDIIYSRDGIRERGLQLDASLSVIGVRVNGSVTVDVHAYETRVQYQHLFVTARLTKRMPEYTPYQREKVHIRPLSYLLHFAGLDFDKAGARVVRIELLFISDVEFTTVVIHLA